MTYAGAEAGGPTHARRIASARGVGNARPLAPARPTTFRARPPSQRRAFHARHRPPNPKDFVLTGSFPRLFFFQQVLPQDVDLLHPPAALEARKHKLKRLVQSPNSFFMDVKCQGCFNITTVFSHSQTVVLCGSCSAVLCQPTGGRARLTEGCSFRRKGD